MSGDDGIEGSPAGAGRGCPICGRPAVARFRPFCSARCADVDLGRWFSGRYRIPTDEIPGDEIPTDETPDGEIPDGGDG